MTRLALLISAILALPLAPQVAQSALLVSSSVAQIAGTPSDEALTAERLIDLVAQRQEGHDAGVGRVACERGAVGCDGFGVGL